jgi:predicted nucleic-acid-binding Zn-ribbon protein
VFRSAAISHSRRAAAIEAGRRKKTNTLGEKTMQCPTCGSDHTQRLEVAFHGGTHTIETKSKSYTPGAVKWASVGADTKTTGTTMSALAMKAAPPPKKRYKQLLIMFGIGLFAVPISAQALLPEQLSWIAGLLIWVWLIGFVYLTVQTFIFNWKVWPQLYRQWEQTWHCNKCGTIYFHED